jgi:hypothetical protein
MLLGLSLFFVGVVLILNGIWLSGRIADREIILINLCVAGISALVALHSAFFAQSVADVRAAAMTLLFAITYLWVAYNRMQGCDGRGLGWFSLIVALSVLPVAATGLAAAQTAFEIWLALSWAVWAVLWFTYFLLLTARREIQRFTAVLTLVSGITTGWLPGLALLYGA